MTAVLVAVTFGALGLAGALLFYVLRLTREERDRSEARAAALTEMIGEGSPADSGLLGASGSLGVSEDWNAAAIPEPMVQAPMFGSATTDGERTTPRLLLAPAIGVLVVGLALTGIYVWNRSDTAAEASPALAPLELVSLRHERQGATLVVSGLVRNPQAGRTISGLSAVAFTYDRQGTFLTSGRVQLDFPRLGAGDESPFAISVPQSAGVSRYRVSFRTEDGVVPHLDRREPAALSSAKAQVTR
jgi:hypothetical protein